MKLVAMGGRELVHGFTLAGVDAVGVEPGPEALSAFQELVRSGDVAVIILSKRLYFFLKEAITTLREQSPLPVVLPLPDRADDMTPQRMSTLVEEFLGMKV